MFLISAKEYFEPELIFYLNKNSIKCLSVYEFRETQKQPLPPQIKNNKSLFFFFTGFLSSNIYPLIRLIILVKWVLSNLKGCNYFLIITIQLYK